jgi:prepilin-type N-terminal cleavage/methylation domain-containing protein
MWLNLKMRKRKSERKACSEQRLIDRKKLTANRYLLTSQKGFTLIEVLVAASILGVIGLTILTTFASGFNVYQRVQSYGGVQANVLLALEGFERDLRNSFPLSTIPIEGESQAINFPAIVQTLETNEGEERVISSIGKISYYFDDATDSLMKSQQEYSQAVSQMQAGEIEGEALAIVDGISISYFSFDEEEKSYNWAESWADEETSTLIGIKIGVNYRDGNRDIELVRTVFLTSSPQIFQEEAEEEGEGTEEG